MKKLLFSCIALFAMTATFGQNDEARFVIVDTLTQKFGFMDRNGNVVIEPQYEEVHLLQRGTPFPFVEGMAAVNKNGKWGFIDIKGNMVIKPQFEEVSDFSEQGYAIGLFDDDHVVFFDKTGKTINIAEYLTNLYFDSNFSEDMVLIVDEYDGLDLKNNKTGETYDDFGLFSEGLLRVTRGGYALYNAEVEGAVSGYIDLTGKVVIPLRFGYPSNDFHEGLASVSYEVSPYEWKIGFIDKTGEFVIEPQFDQAGNFNEGLALVELNGKYGFIDKTGKFVIEPQFRDASQFFEGLAIIETIDFKQGVIDKSGKIVFGPVDAGINPFKDGLAIVFEKDDVYYIDKTGKRVLNFLR